jgi:hypothetical protein
MTTRGARITETDSTVELVTTWSQESFAEVERLFQPDDIDKLTDLAAKQKSSPPAPTMWTGQPDFGMFSQLDMGSLMRPAGIPIECTLYLIGSVTTWQGLFRYYGATTRHDRRVGD